MVDGAAFVELTEDDVKTMIKPLGQVKRVLRLIKSKINSEVSLHILIPYSTSAYLLYLS